MSVLDDFKNPNHPKYDPYLPITDNLPHQQYDPYGIYSIAAITHRDEGRIREFTGFVAYQKYDVHPITVDFRALVERYGNNDLGGGNIVVGGF
jgi:hypothetical protein